MHFCTFVILRMNHAYYVVSETSGHKCFMNLEVNFVFELSYVSLEII